MTIILQMRRWTRAYLPYLHRRGHVWEVKDIRRQGLDGPLPQRPLATGALGAETSPESLFNFTLHTSPDASISDVLVCMSRDTFRTKKGKTFCHKATTVHCCCRFRPTSKARNTMRGRSWPTVTSPLQARPSSFPASSHPGFLGGCYCDIGSKVSRV